MKWMPAVIIGVALTATSAFAQSVKEPRNETEQHYYDLRLSVEAAKECRDLDTSDQATADAVGDAVEKAMGRSIGPGPKLGLMRAARDEVRRKLLSSNCSDTYAQGALDRFDAEIAPNM